MYCIVMYCIILHCNVSYCIVLYQTERLKPQFVGVNLNEVRTVQSHWLLLIETNMPEVMEI